MENPVGRNDPCPCGSGKKYKKCCMKSQGQSSGLKGRIVKPQYPVHPPWRMTKLSWVEPLEEEDLLVSAWKDYPRKGGAAEAGYPLKSHRLEPFDLKNPPGQGEEWAMSRVSYL